MHGIVAALSDGPEYLALILITWGLMQCHQQNNLRVWKRWHPLYHGECTGRKSNRWFTILWMSTSLHNSLMHWECLVCWPTFHKLLNFLKSKVALSGQVKELGTECLVLWQKTPNHRHLWLRYAYNGSLWDLCTETELDRGEPLQADNKYTKSRQEWWGYLVPFGESERWVLLNYVQQGSCWVPEIGGLARGLSCWAQHTLSLPAAAVIARESQWSSEAKIWQKS